MTSDPKDNFNGFITKDGELVALDDVERMFTILTRGARSADDLRKTLLAFAGECLRHRLFEGAYGYLDKVLTLTDDPAALAECLLRMGLSREASGDFEAAREVYARAFTMPQEADDTWYFLNNNLAYCLNKTGRHQEAEQHARAAIAMDPARHNAHKNLGIALQGLGRYTEAAESFMQAIKIYPADGRVLDHLRDLIRDHPEILDQSGELRRQALDCLAAETDGPDLVS